jgi:Mrp family chromosome partitioning ATPase
MGSGVPEGISDRGFGNIGAALRRYWPLVAVVTLIGLVAGAVAAQRKGDRYTSSARMVLTPFTTYEETFVGLPVFRLTGDVTQTTETAAAVLDNVEVATATAKRLDGEWTPSSVMDAITVTPFGQSTVLLVRAQADRPSSAVRLANTYAATAVDVREQRFQAQLTERIRFLEERKRELPVDDYGAQNDAGSRLNALRALREQGSDPTLSLGGTAEPAKATGTPAALLIPIGGLAGLVLGTLAALALALPGRRVTSTDEALSLYRLPVLGRLPKRRERFGLPNGRSRGAPSAAVTETFRRIAARLEHRGAQRAVMITSASRGDGRTTVTAGLGRALADLGFSVVVIDCDFHKPQLSAALGLSDTRMPPPVERDSAWSFNGELGVMPLTSRLAMLPLGATAGSDPQDVLRELPAILADLKRLADYVVIDTPPLGEVSHGLRVAAHVDDVIVAVRPGNTDISAFRELGDVLDQTGISPLGMVLVGDGRRDPSRRGPGESRSTSGRQDPSRPSDWLARTG